MKFSSEAKRQSHHNNPAALLASASEAYILEPWHISSIILCFTTSKASDAFASMTYVCAMAMLASSSAYSLLPSGIRNPFSFQPVLLPIQMVYTHPLMVDQSFPRGKIITLVLQSSSRRGEMAAISKCETNLLKPYHPWFLGG